MSRFLISVGGTGAKIVESFVFLASSGLIDSSLDVTILFVDQDSANGNFQRARDAVNRYKESRAFFKKESGSPLFGPDINLFNDEAWTPVKAVGTSLADYLGYNTLYGNPPTKPLAHLMDILFSKQEREFSLDKGFRGRPSIGAAPFNLEIDIQEEEPWKTLFARAKESIGTGEECRAFVAGSIFGGTGASGIPTIGRRLTEEFDNIIKESEEEVTSAIATKHKRPYALGTVPVLPFFSFDKEKIPPEDQDVIALPDNFLVKSRVALQYYYVRDYLKYYDSIYLIGNDSLMSTRSKSASIGSKQQINDAHFVDVLNALAALHFFKGETGKVKSIWTVSREGQKEIVWSDFPEPHLKATVGSFVRFCYAYRSLYHHLITNATSNTYRLLPWYIDNFGFGPLKDDETSAANKLNEFCGRYLSWIEQIHLFKGDEKIQLVDFSKFGPDAAKNSDIEAIADVVPASKGFRSSGASSIWHRLSAGNPRSRKGLASFASSLANETKLEK